MAERSWVGAMLISREGRQHVVRIKFDKAPGHISMLGVVYEKTAETTKGGYLVYTEVVKQ